MAYVSYMLTNRVVSDSDKDELEALLIPFSMQLLGDKSRTYKPLVNGDARIARIPKAVEAAGTGAMIEEFGCLPARSTFGHESDFAHAKQVSHHAASMGSLGNGQVFCFCNWNCVSATGPRKM